MLSEGPEAPFVFLNATQCGQQIPPKTGITETKQSIVLGTRVATASKERGEKAAALFFLRRRLLRGSGAATLERVRLQVYEIKLRKIASRKMAVDSHRELRQDARQQHIRGPETKSLSSKRKESHSKGDTCAAPWRSSSLPCSQLEKMLAS